MADMGHAGGPCDWPAGPCPEDFYGLEDEQAAAEVEAEAVFILWSFTGQRYGLCEVTLESPPVCRCSGLCCCGKCVLWLPGPVHEVLSVDSGGEPVEDWVQRGDQLLRTTPWPSDLVVTYQRGIPPPAGAARVVAGLAQQLAYARCNPSKCQLPPNLTQRTRQGDTVQFNRARQHEPEHTGIPTIDLWIRAANGANPPGRVWSPDIEPMVPVGGGS